MLNCKLLEWVFHICYVPGIQKIEVKFDSSLLVNWGSRFKKTKPPWFLFTVWKEIKELEEDIQISVTHVYREGNQVGDCLAKLGSSLMFFVLL